MYTFESRVRYSEVNSEKRMTLPALLDYLQDCCTFQSEELGVGIDYLANEQTAWVLSSWELEIAEYPQMGARIRVNTWPYDFKGFYGFRNFTIEDESGKLLVRANSLWVYMDMVKMRPARITEYVQQTYRKELGEPLPGAWSDRKITVFGEGEKVDPVQVAGFFIDTNHHMNNGKYILVAEEYLPDGFEAAGLRAEYKKAAVLGDVLYPTVILEDGQVTVSLEDEVGKAYAVVQFLQKIKKEI